MQMRVRMLLGGTGLGSGSDVFLATIRSGMFDSLVLVL
jgi:hypothetical protein